VAGEVSWKVSSLAQTSLASDHPDAKSTIAVLFLGDYDAHSRFASKILPLPFPPSAPESQASTATSSVSQAPPSRPASTDPSGIGSSALSSVSGKPDSVYATRAIPLRLYLPEGAPVIQEVIPPLNSEGEYNQLGESRIVRMDFC
jgi:hypothetical protein